MAAEQTTADVLTRPADKRYGYRFGCDGTLTVIAAAKRLGVSRSTVDRLYHRGILRKGRVEGRAVICVRSLNDYMDTIEL